MGKRRDFAVLVGLGVLVLAVASCSTPLRTGAEPAASAPGNGCPFSLPSPGVSLALTEHGNPLIMASVNGQGPFAMIFDTAASGTVLDPGLADRLGLTRSSAAVDAAAAGGAFSAMAIEHVTVRAGPFELHDATVPAIPSPVLPETKVDGVVGADLWLDQRVVVDLLDGALAVVDETEPSPVCWRTVEARFDPQSHGVSIPVRVGTIVGRAVLDTGAQATLINPAFARRIGVTDANRQPAGQMRGADGRALVIYTSDPQPVDFGAGATPAKRLLTADAPIFAALGGADESLMILGMDRLKGTRLIIDYRARKIWFYAL